VDEYFADGVHAVGCFKGDPSMKNCTSGKGIFQKWQKKVEEVRVELLPSLEIDFGIKSYL